MASSKRYVGISDKMIQQLMDCHERELLRQEPYLYGTHRSRALLRRGLLEVKKFIRADGKEITGLFVTDSGRKLLDRLG